MSELRTITRHAGTVLVGQLATMAFAVADTVIAGRYRPEALAALSVGAAVFASVFVALVGTLQALLPVWAELRGAGKQEEVGRSVRQALYVAFAAVVVGGIALLCPGPLLRWADVPVELQGDVEHYLAILAMALPASMLFRGYSTLNQSLGRPLLVTWLQLASLAVKVPLSIWFTFGGLGVPALGLAGCAYATLCVQWLMVLVAAWTLRTHAFYEPYALWRRMEPPHGPTLRAFAKLGVPTALAVLVEVTSFTLMALLIARMGIESSAGHQIAGNVAALMYMTPLSLALATSARVSYWRGAGNERQARHALRVGYKLALGLAVGTSCVVALLHDRIAHLYAGDRPAVLAVAGGLLLWVAVYHVADAMQAVGVFLLRSYGVATRPLVVYCVMLWGVGLGGGYLLAYAGAGPIAPLRTPAAFWSAGAVALFFTAAAFTALLWQVVRERRSPAG